MGWGWCFWGFAALEEDGKRGFVLVEGMGRDWWRGLGWVVGRDVVGGGLGWVVVL